MLDFGTARYLVADKHKTFTLVHAIALAGFFRGGDAQKTLFPFMLFLELAKLLELFQISLKFAVQIR